MTIKEIVRAWKNPLYRKQLSAEELALLPAHPAGEVELSEAELDQVAGAELGTGADGCNSVGNCTFTSDPTDGQCATYGCQTNNTYGLSCSTTVDTHGTVVTYYS